MNNSNASKKDHMIKIKDIPKKSFEVKSEIEMNLLWADFLVISSGNL